MQGQCSGRMHDLQSANISDATAVWHNRSVYSARCLFATVQCREAAHLVSLDKVSYLGRETF